MKKIQKIGFLRALQLGDFLCCIPAVRALREAFPNAHIAWIGLPGNSGLAQRFAHYIDEYIPFPGYPGLPEQAIDPPAIVAFIQKIQQSAFDLVLQLQGNGTYVNGLVTLFNARITAGFYKNDIFRPNENYFIPYPEDMHEIERHLALIRHLKLPVDSTVLEFPILIDRSPINEKYSLEPQTYICIHPGSRGSWRQWPPTYFALIADFCIKNGYRIVLTGTAGEKDIVNAVAAHMQYDPILLAGETDLDELAILLKQARGLIANCTGIAHIAYALHTPSIIISMDGEPHRWGPPKNYRHKIINWLETPCYDLAVKAFNEVFMQQTEL